MLRRPNRNRLRVVALLMLLLAVPAVAQQRAPGASERIAEGKLQKRSKTLRGAWWIEQRAQGQVLVFGEDFKARSGPDLKLFLSPQEFSAAEARNATEAALYLGELKATRGRQEYPLPADVSLENYASVLVHCERYAVLWGGDDLR